MSPDMQCFRSRTIPEDDKACELAIAVLEHVSLVHADLGPEYVMTLLPLGLQLFAEGLLDRRLGLPSIAFMKLCLYYQAIGYLSEGFVNTVLVAGERMIVQEEGYGPYVDTVILMAKANGADRVVRNLLRLDGIQGEPITHLFDSAGQAIWSRDTLRALLREHYAGEEAVDCISRFLANASADGNE